MTTRNELPIIYVQGNHLEIGQQIGEAMRPQIQHSVENARVLLQKAYDQLQLTWDGASIQARKYMLFAEEHLPQYVEELHGVSEGAGVDYNDICIVNAMEGVTSDALHLTKCSSIAVNQSRTANGNVLVAHNEDWTPEDESDVYLVHAKPDKEPPFLAMSYGGLLPNIGFNAHGIAQACDSVYPEDGRIGIPRILYSRAVLAAKTPADAIRSILVPQRAAGYNHLIVHESGELYNIEVSARQFGMIYGEDGYLVHTNFYLDPVMRSIENEPDELISARVRYYRALRLLKQTSKHTVKTLQEIQKDHVNYPDSICNHGIDKNVLNSEKTIMAMVIDLTTHQMHATWGSPCKNSYTTYQLNA
jgi:isopenicillin-N N-acyltransferase-like protein